MIVAPVSGSAICLPPPCRRVNSDGVTAAQGWSSLRSVCVAWFTAPPSGGRACGWPEPSRGFASGERSSRATMARTTPRIARTTLRIARRPAHMRPIRSTINTNGLTIAASLVAITESIAPVQSASWSGGSRPELSLKRRRAGDGRGRAVRRRPMKGSPAITVSRRRARARPRRDARSQEPGPYRGTHPPFLGGPLS